MKQLYRQKFLLYQNLKSIRILAIFVLFTAANQYSLAFNHPESRSNPPSVRNVFNLSPFRSSAPTDNQAGRPEFRYGRFRYLPGQPDFTGYEHFSRTELANMPIADLRHFARLRRDLLRSAATVFPDFYNTIRETYYRAYSDFSAGNERDARSKFIEVIRASDNYLTHLPARSIADEQEEMAVAADDMLQYIDIPAMNFFFPDKLERAYRLHREIIQAYQTGKAALSQSNFHLVSRGNRNEYMATRLEALRRDILPYSRTADKAERLSEQVRLMFLAINYWRARGLRELDPGEFWRRHETAIRIRRGMEAIFHAGLQPSDYSTLCSLYDTSAAILAHLNEKGSALINR